MVLVMGLGMPAALWSPVRDRLVDSGVTAHAFDHRGVGQRADQAPRTDMAGLAADLLAELDVRGLDRVHLVGISMGGMVAQELAVRRPDRLRSLALIATAASAADLLPPSGPALSALLFERDREARLSRLLFPAEVRDDPAFRRRAEVMARSAAPPATFRAHLRAVLGHRASHRLGTLRLPTLVVAPRRDVLIPPRCSDTLARLIPNARLEAFAGAGHGLIAQVPDALAALLALHAAAAEAG